MIDSRSQNTECTKIYGRRLPPWLLPQSSAPTPAHTGNHCFGFSLYCSPELFNAHANKKQVQVLTCLGIVQTHKLVYPSFTTSSLI